MWREFFDKFLGPECEIPRVYLNSGGWFLTAKRRKEYYVAPEGVKDRETTRRREG